MSIRNWLSGNGFAEVAFEAPDDVLFSVGVQVPVTERETRSKSVMAYLLWDWFDGGLFELWRAK